MRTAAKVFVILGMITGCWYILPLIFGGICLSKINHGHKPGIGWAILEFFFGGYIFGIIACILILLSDKDDYYPIPRCAGKN
ncbi:MAG: hypothetical protein LUD50_01425 [Clostridia bacterium]|nr:hypothetical protein [Clostridia bacterium]